ncbi:MAG: hypothetical protein HY903_06565 [Deltaproteobacteria bacterium]|nr:hypothetical protein [Deltaproteobacteria bacterium]
MSSISSSPGYQSTTIDYVGNNRYRVLNERDKDGDGVVDGKALSGDEGKIVNEGTVNQLLKARGLQAANGSFQSVDGFQINASNSSAVTTFGSDPVLPSVSGKSAAASSLRGQFDWFEMSQGLSDAALMWKTLSTLAHTAMRDMKDAGDIRDAMQKGKIEAKSNEIKAAESRIAAEKAAATQTFIWSCASAAVTAIAGTTGANAGLAGGLGEVVKSYGNMVNKTSGPQAEADRQQIREKEFSKQAEIMDMAIDEAKSNYDESKELFKNALKAISDHVDRESQATQAITRG